MAGPCVDVCNSSSASVVHRDEHTVQVEETGAHDSILCWLK